MGIEPTLEAWEAAVLPLNYTRSGVVPSAQSRSRGGDYSAPFFIAAGLPPPYSGGLRPTRIKYVPNLVRLDDSGAPDLPLQFGL